jgi:hypothetical protein
MNNLKYFDKSILSRVILVEFRTHPLYALRHGKVLLLLQTRWQVMNEEVPDRTSYKMYFGSCFYTPIKLQKIQ